MENQSPPLKSSDNLTHGPSPVNADSPPSMGSGAVKRHLAKAAGMMGAFTLLSRILGMLRDIVCAKSFGTSWHWDGFIFAFMVPNLFRRLVGEGALSSAFIPVYSKTLQQEGKDAAFRFANVTWTMMVVLFLVFLAVVEFLLHFILKWDALSPTLRLAFDLMRIFFPFLWMMSLYALSMGILNSHKHFFSSSLGPCIINIFWIGGVLWVLPHLSQNPVIQLRWLAVILLLAAFVELLFEWPFLHRIGFRFHWVWDTGSRELLRTYRLLLPSVLGFAVVQINIMIDMTLGLSLGAGANSSLWYGNRLMQFPLAIFAIAMGTALLPTISSQMAQKDYDSVKSSMSFAIRTICFVVIPASIGLIVLREPIVQLLFERGKFDAESTARTAAVLMCYSVGLFAYSGQKIIASGFYAAEDTRTPVRVAVITLISNVVLNLILMQFFREAGLALGTAIAGIFQFFILFFLYQKKVMKLDLRELMTSVTKITVAAFLMGGVSWLFMTRMPFFQSSETWMLGIGLLSGILLSILCYFLFCALFRVKEMEKAIALILSRFKAPRKVSS